MMSKRSSVIVMIAVTIMLCGAPPEGRAQADSSTTKPWQGATSVPWPGSTPPKTQNNMPPQKVQPSNAGSQQVPTLGDVLNEEAQTQPFSQDASGFSTRTNPTPQTHQSWGEPRGGIGLFINDIKGMVRDMVQVDLDKGDPNVKVRAPFVNVDVNHGQPNVNVKAPFVNVNKANDAPVSVEAPFVNISPKTPSQSAPPTNQ